ncbi:MAG TPA: AAA family ATPase, partial [Thermomicrobiales bacterium]|nr:AAA family ATPase [Thermomicrobiales bacterium]
VRGIASELVGAAPEIGAIVEALLGRTVVVADLPAARAVLSSLPTGWSAVTLAGDIARAGGSVTGGAAVATSGALGRERELRDLPATVADLERDAAATRERRETLAEMARQADEAARRLEAERTAVTAAGSERARQRARLVRWRDELQREQAADDRRLAALAEHATAACSELDQTVAALECLAAEAAALTAEHDAARAELSRATEALQSDRAAADASQRLAALEERLRAERRRDNALRQQARALADELALRGERTAALDRERETLAAHLHGLTATHDDLARELAGLDAARPPLDRALRAADAAVRRFAADLDAARQVALDRERATHAAWLERERAQGEQRALLRRIADELEMEDAASLLAGGGGGETPAGDAATREREMQRLKERLRRLGYVGDDAVADYERESARQAFLREQLADVEAAAGRLRGLLLDLQRAMRQRFAETFARVADAFAATFATLFGGGTARLVLTGGEDGGEPGIDIVAQPPGKRLQNLALLSGGERALTAAALLFAILQVNPAPFCLLDEVDAALDEANVVRFRERLRALADQTQVIVVTHNRGTIETADTLYGVSMGADGVSQVLSLRLEDPAPAD